MHDPAEAAEKIGLQVPFGAVYFRKSNPPRADWERDYRTAAEDGLNVFRHWFMWSAIERAPGRYDFDDYDRQLDLAARHGIKTIIAELTHTAPDWAYRKYAHARQLRADGTPLASIMGVSAATGGFAANGGGGGALTFNCPEVMAAAGAFLEALATRYRGHQGLLGYDVWNECNYSPLVDYSSHTQAAFRVWLQDKYGSLDALAEAWHRYSYAEWDDVQAPTQTAPYPECLDWIEFKREDYYRQMQFRIDRIRAADPGCLIVAHGVAGAIADLAARGCDDWLAASKVEAYGYTWVQARKGTEPWQNFFGGDLTRAAARGKPFWHAERQGGPLWMQPQVLGRDKEDGRVATPADLRLWSLSSLAAGARGMMNLRYRPLLDGPLFGAFGSYAMDGGRTPRSAMASEIARWANAAEQTALMAARPVHGDVGILLVPETQQWDYLLSHEGGFDTYAAAMWGAYRGFFDNNIQADWVHVDDIDAWDRLYLPYPIMLPATVAARIAAWVENGGRLIAEACPGYFGDRGRVGTVQPNNGLDRLFGAVEDEVEFMPDIGDRIRFTLDGLELSGGGFLQSYRLNGGTARGFFADGRLAVVEHRPGKGQALLVGTHPSVGYHRRPAAAGKRFFADCLAWTSRCQHVACSNPKVQVRLHQGDGGRNFVWLVNPARTRQSGRLAFALGGGSAGRVFWGGEHGWTDGTAFEISAQDALVCELAFN